MICTCIQHRTYDGILDILNRPDVEMAEIRLDRCSLSDEEIRDLFSNCDTPLIATCRVSEAGEQKARTLLSLAIESGARFADLETDAPVRLSKTVQKLCHDYGTELIRSYHNFDFTPSEDELGKILARCFRYGADIAKIVTMCTQDGDMARLSSLYSVILEEQDSLQGKLIAFGLGDAARESRLDCLRRGAPFSYSSLEDDASPAPGQWPHSDFRKAVYGGLKPFVRKNVRMPASKSFAQRAIIAAALADGNGESVLGAYTPCDDSESAIQVAVALGASVERRGDSLVIRGTGLQERDLNLDRLDTGESGLLTRLMIPLVSAIGKGPIRIEGRGTLMDRHLEDVSGIMAAFGVIVKEEKVPLTVRGHLIPGTADISGRSGSQLISGLLMSLPLCSKPSNIYVSEPKSIPYMYITLDILRRFGVRTRTEMEGDAEMLELQDWSSCSGISFSIKENQKYKAASFDLERDWSSAACFMVAGAVFGCVEIEGLDVHSLQADISIMDILVDAGASVSQMDNVICVRKAPLEAFDTNLDNAPDLFPICAVLAAFCSGESRIGGLGRLGNKESDRASAIFEMLSRMGVEFSVDDDTLTVAGETLAGRRLSGHLLKGGQFSTHHDHRMLMALKVAAMGADSPVIPDDEDCVCKSFPDFNQTIQII